MEDCKRELYTLLQEDVSLVSFPLLSRSVTVPGRGLPEHPC